MPDVFTYETDQFRPAYDIKWTILQHIRHIVNRNKVFSDLFSSGLPEDHFYDALSNEYKLLPAFGVDYVGKRVVGSEVQDLFLIRYVGKRIEIKPFNRYGIQSENRRLLNIHDDLYNNFIKLSRRNGLVILQFRDDTLDPVESAVGFTMDLLDSIPSRDENTHARVNSLEMTYGLKINL